MTDLNTFRRETRAWLEAHCPSTMRLPLREADDSVWGGRQPTFRNDEQKVWFERMVEKRWTAPEWPVEFGGGGLSKAEGKILREEMKVISARPPLMSFGIWMLGPALLKYGTDAQKQKPLPPITRREISWEQGSSEPTSGSDLAYQ